MIEQTKVEIAAFEAVKQLVQSKGYIHVLARILRDNDFLLFKGAVTADGLLPNYLRDKLIPSEISIIIGLMAAIEIDFNYPGDDIISYFISQTNELMSVLHKSIHSDFFPKPDPEVENPFSNPKSMREPIIYGGLSAYNFQYAEFSKDRYKHDDAWFSEKLGFTIKEAQAVVLSLSTAAEEALAQYYEHGEENKLHGAKILEIYLINPIEVSKKSGVVLATVLLIIRIFSIEASDNEEFKNVTAYNKAVSHPIIKSGDCLYLFQPYMLLQSLYNSPFYWMMKDKKYKEKATQHRGNYGEDLACSLLKKVFGPKNVFKNVEIQNRRGETLGEIDVLVVFSNRALVLQAKSKKLTEKARSGDERAITKDFYEAVQTAANQAHSCAELLLNDGAKLVLRENGEELNVRRNYAEIMPICIVTEHYPSLEYQAKQMLTAKSSSIITRPLVADIFFLDALCEFLNNPLFFLTYVSRRISLHDGIMSGSELAILGYHLKANLWKPDDIDMFYISEDCAMDIDAAFYVRRNNLPGNPTPTGILTKFRGTAFGKIISEIVSTEHDGVVDLGYMLLRADEISANAVADGIILSRAKSLQDGLLHDFTIQFGDKGFTFHARTKWDDEGLDHLQAHCHLRKYKGEANKWFGIASDCTEPYLVKHIYLLLEPWEHSEAEDELIKGAGLPELGKRPMELKKMLSKKPGRNELCPCGSQIKYKKCHGR